MTKKYITEKELLGWNPDGPDYPENDGSIIIPANTVLLGTEEFDEYSMEFVVESVGVSVCLPRERICDDAGDTNYYANYFTLPQGVKELILPPTNI